MLVHSHSLDVFSVDEFVLLVLGESLEEIGTEKGRMRQYAVKQLPTQEEYTKLKTERFTVDASELLEEAKAEVEAVGEELQDWYDNLPEGFQASLKGEAISEAASTLQSVTIPEYPAKAETIKVCFYPPLNVVSRNHRCGKAADMLRTIGEKVEDYIEAKRKESRKYKDNGLEEFVGECIEAADEIEGVEIPGMYG